MDVLTPDESAALSSIAQTAAQERGLEVLRIAIRGSKSRPVLEVILDGARQVSIEDCEVLSKTLQGYLDTTLGTETNYRLDVLSPGTDEPLVHPYQFKRVLGRKIEVTTDDGKKTGRLKETSESGILLTLDQKKKSKPEAVEEVSVAFTDVRKAKVIVEL